VNISGAFGDYSAEADGQQRGVVQKPFLDSALPDWQRSLGCLAL